MAARRSSSLYNDRWKYGLWNSQEQGGGSRDRVGLGVSSVVHCCILWNTCADSQLSNSGQIDRRLAQDSLRGFRCIAVSEQRFGQKISLRQDSDW